MRSFPHSFGNIYILVGVDYASKSVKVVACKSNDHKVVLKFLKDNIFSRFSIPRAIIRAIIKWCSNSFVFEFEILYRDDIFGDK